MRSVRLIQFTDTHLRGQTAATFKGIDTLASLTAAVAHGAQRFAKPDGVLLTGDLVDEDPTGYRWVRQLFGSSAVPVLCLAGNHDLPDDLRRTLAGAPFQIGGQMRFDRWLVVMLDTWVAGSAAGRLGRDQLQDLDRTLRAHRNDHVLLCLHHHPVAMRSRWLDTVGLEDADEFVGLIRRSSNVRGVLWGHVHQALDNFLYGVRFMASPATCAQFLPGSEDFAMDARPPGYRVLELMPDGSIATEVVWLESFAAARSVA
jgi:Icc protein